jgi:Rieske Fe-S protein
MAGALAASYGTFAAFAGRFIYPARARDKAWLFVVQTRAMKSGDSMDYRTPAGAPVTITRRASHGDPDDFLALSATCPHLGCQVRWEAQNDRFFCPCHNGVFDPSGKATGGPPGEAGQSLPRYELKVEGGNLHIAVPPPRFADADRPGIMAGEAAISGPGHDPCLDCDSHFGRETAG